MSEIIWLENMKRVLKYVMATAVWEPHEAEGGITHRGRAVLPGLGAVTVYRLYTGQEIFTEDTLAILLTYTNYERLHVPMD
jgi:hypothetical protein